MLSILDLFRIGIGPSSSHTVGPMRIANRWVADLVQKQLLSDVTRVRVVLYGSLAHTGRGHGSDRAVVLGLLGNEPETLDPDNADCLASQVSRSGQLLLGENHPIAFNRGEDIVFDYEDTPELHPNKMRLTGFGTCGSSILDEVYYSTGGGFVASEAQLRQLADGDLISVDPAVPHPFHSANDLLEMCEAERMTIDEIVRANEARIGPGRDLDARLDAIAAAMLDCIERGLASDGILPGWLRVERRAPKLWRKLREQAQSNEQETLFDWLNLYAMAVNEENAAGGRVVTAPTNGAAGIIPAIIRHYSCAMDTDRSATRRFLLTAGGIGLLFKQRASISGAEMGCQGEVGVACSMAAGGLTAIWGGTPQQVACAAEIAMEHNLGLTCDPVGGLVQIPCIERNAIGTVKAVNAARLAMHGSGHAKVSLDQVIETMRQTGYDMSSKYKETSQGGLAVNVVEC